MAFNITDTTYSGTMSSYFIKQATFSMDTVEKQLVYVKSGIKKMHKVGRLDYINPLKPRMAVPTTKNANPFVIDSRLIVPKSFDIYEEFNPRDLEEHELAEQLSNTILDRHVPQGFEEQMMQLVLDRAGESWEEMMWMGSMAYAGVVLSTDHRYQLQYFNGFMQKFVNDPLINLSSVAPATITAANVFTIMDDLLTQLTTKKKGLLKNGMQNLVYMMSPKTANIFVQAQRTGTDFKGMALDMGFLPRWSGYRVESVAGMPDNTIIFCRASDTIDSNLWLGMNSEDDWELKIQRTLPKNETFFIQAKFKADVQYGQPGEIFMFTNLTPAYFIP